MDVSAFKCPRCGHCCADASWHVVELESDIECGACHVTFNAKKRVIDRVMLEFALDRAGKIFEVWIIEHISSTLGGRFLDGMYCCNLFTSSCVITTDTWLVQDAYSLS